MTEEDLCQDTVHVCCHLPAAKLFFAAGLCFTIMEVLIESGKWQGMNLVTWGV